MWLLCVRLLWAIPELLLIVGGWLFARVIPDGDMRGYGAYKKFCVNGNKELYSVSLMDCLCRRRSILRLENVL